MKHLATKLSIIGITLFLIIPSCKKDKKEDLLTFSHRIISEKYYYNNQLDGEVVYQYTGNKLSKIIWDIDEVTLITYPETNKILIKEEGDDTYHTSITLSDNRITEYLEYYEGDPENKGTFNYNSAGDIVKMNYYSYDGGWELDAEVTFTYTSGKLIKIEIYDTWDNQTYEDRYVYSYNGTEIADVLHTYRQGTGDWVNCHKDVYSYSDNKVSGIEVYYYEEGWVIGGSSSYLYDTNGNLIKETINDETGSWVDYQYEEGSGNYRLFFETTDYDFGRPLPNKSVREKTKFPVKLQLRF